MAKSSKKAVAIELKNPVQRPERVPGPGAGLRDIHEPLQGTKEGSWGLGEMCDVLLKDGQIDLDVEYQRGHVWSVDQQKRFVGHLLEGGAMPDVWMRVMPYVPGSSIEYECVDGKQRITALHAWWRGEISGVLSEENDYREIWADDLDAIEWRNFKNTQVRIKVQFLEGYSEAQILRVYLRLNRGIQHTEEELDRVQALYKLARKREAR